MKIFVPIFVPNENIYSKWKCFFQKKYLFQMKIFVPNGFNLSKRKYFCNDYKLCWLISSVYIINFWKWTGNIFSKWKTNLHLPHRLAQSLLGVTKPETGILNINNFYISENQSFFLIWSCSIFLSFSHALILMRTMTSLMTLLQMLLNSSPSM